MKYPKWNLPPAPVGTDLLEQAGYPPLIAAILAARQVDSAQAAEAFLAADRSLLHSPFLLKDMDRAVARIRQAMAAGEMTAVYGDYDVDGITATCLLTQFLESEGLPCLRYIPDRIEDGYGLGRAPLEMLRQKGVSLIITVDCGITAVEEVDFARSLGMDVVITDHHECKGLLPDAAAVVNPHRPDCDYPFPHLAGVGVAFKLALALGGKDREEELFDRYCTLAALGTVADVMRMTGENRAMVRQGMAGIGAEELVGLSALLDEAGLSGKPLRSSSLGFILAPRINAAGRMGQADLAAELLMTRDPLLAKDLAEQLCGLNSQRQSTEQQIFKSCLAMLEEQGETAPHAIVLASEEWHQGVVGIVASRLSEQYACPTFIICLNGDRGKGSCRSYGGFHLFSALEQTSDLLESFGGHAMAAGFTILRENIDAFRERMSACARESQGEEAPVAALDLDILLEDPRCLTLEAVEALSLLEPYGTGNEQPVFCLPAVRINSLQTVGGGKHLKLHCSAAGCPLDGIFFSATAENCGLAAGDLADVAFFPQVNEFRGRKNVQLRLVDLRPSQLPDPREQAALDLYRRFRREEKLTPKEALRLLPVREEFAVIWRRLQRRPAESLQTLDLLAFSRELAGSEPLLRCLLALDVFQERGLLALEGEFPLVRVTLPSAPQKVDLEDSVILRKLRGLCHE